MADDVTLPGTGAVVDTIQQTDGSHRQKVAIGGFGNNESDVIGALTETAPASDTASSGLNGRLQRVAQRLSSMLTLWGSSTDAKATQTDTTSLTFMQVFKQLSASLQTIAGAIVAGSSGSPATSQIAMAATLRDVNANGQAAMSASAPVALATDQRYQTGMSPRVFSAAFTTLTRPANVTAYSAGDSISNNATAGSVTALSATVSDTNDDPVTISEILIKSTDTGLAGKKLRAYIFNSDPTASTGVGAGDNAAYSQKVAGYVGSFMGYMETGFSDGCVGRLVPTYNETNLSQAGAFVLTSPVSGAKTLYIQFQAVEAFTPSANSTTIIATAKGFQGRAA